MSIASMFSFVRGIRGFVRSGSTRSGFASALMLAILSVLACGPVASAQSVDFFGSFTSYNQSIVVNAQGIVANAVGGLYISGTSNLIYIPVDANHDPISADEVSISSTGSNCLGLAIDSTNNLYRPDPSAGNVQMFTYVGNYSTYTSSTPTYIGSGWSKPSSVVVDSSNNVYVLDAGNGTIVKLTPNGSGGFTQATIYTNANLVNTTGMSIDSYGNFYIASGPNYGTSPISSTTTAVYKLTNSSGSYTLSSLGSGWSSPSSTAVDFAGNLWVTDYGSGTVYLLTTTNGTSYTQTAYTTISRLRTLTVNKTGEVYGLAYGSGDAVIYAGGSAPHFLGAYNVGTAAPTVTVQVSFPSATTVSSFSVLTQGVTGLDITNAGTGTCAPGTQAANSTCTVNVSFTPSGVGVRSGVLQLVGSGGTVLASNYFYGIGLGPVLQFQPASVSTWAGTGAQCITNNCNSGDAATSVTFDHANTIIFDNSNNAYIPDIGDNMVWKITPGGVATVIAGTSSAHCTSPTSACGDGGQGTSALLSGPSDLAIDGAGNLYISDKGDNRVRVLNLNTGIINAFAGTGATCSNPAASSGACGDGGSALSATMSSIDGLDVDFYGDVYIGDTNDHRIREVSQSTGLISTIAGTGNLCSPATGVCGDGGLATSAEVNYPNKIRFDPNGNLYIADSSANRVRVIDAISGNISTVAGTGATCSSPTATCGDGGAATSAQMGTVWGLALDGASNLYIVDNSDNRIRFVNSTTGVISTVLGTGAACPSGSSACGDGGTAATATINNPVCVAYQATGNVYVCDQGDDRVRELTFNASALSFASTVIGSTSTDSPKSVSLTNAGNAALTFSVPSTGNNPSIASGYSLSGTCPTVSSSGSAQSVAVGGSCSYSVDFTPVAAGTDNGSLQLTDNNLGISASQQTISLTGTGLANVSLLAFGTLPASPVKAGGNAGSAVTVQEENSSDAVVTTATDLITLTVTGPNSYSATYYATAVAGVATFNLSTDILSTTGIYTYTATLTGVTSAATTEAVYTTSYTPPSEPVGTPGPTQTAVIPFTSSFTLGGISVVTGGATGKDYNVASGGSCTTGTAYTSGSACTVNYTFTPTAPGVRNGAIVLTDSSGNVVETVYLTGIGTAPLIGFTPGTASTLGSGLNQSFGEALDGNGNLFVADYGNGKIKEILKTGGYTTIQSIYSLSLPAGMAIDGAGNIYFAGYSNGNIYKMLASNAYASATVIASGYTHPFGVAVDGSGNVFVLARNNVVQELPLTGNATYGSAVTIGSGFSNPFGIALDSSDNVYIADNGNGKVKEVLKSGGYTTVNTLGSGFSTPVGVAVDNNGNVYVADSTTNKVSEILAVSGSIPATPAINTLITDPNTPISLTLDSLDNVYYGTNLSGDGIHKLDYSDAPTVTFPTSTIEGLADATDDPLPVTITNNGNANLSFASAGFGSIFTKDGSSTCSTSSPVAGGASCKYGVDFTPTSVGTNNGTLLLTDNNLNVSAQTQTVSFVGTGVAPVTKLVYGSAPVTPIILGQGAGTITVQEENASNAVVTQAVNTITLTVTGPNSYSQTYTSTAVAGVATFNLATPTFGNGQAGTYTYTATLTGVTSAVASEVVNLDPTTITWTPSTTNLTYGASLNGLLNATNSQTSTCTYTATPTGEAVTNATVLGAGTYTIAATCTPTNGTMYAVSTASFSLTINKATLTVTAGSSTITYGGTVPTYTATYSGYQNGDTIAVVIGAPSLTTSPTTPSAVGSYTITAAQGTLAAVNYNFTFVNGLLTIGKSSSTVSGSASTVVYNQTASDSFTITGKYVGTGIAVPTGSATYTIVNSSSTTVASGTLTLFTSSAASSVVVPEPSTIPAGSYTVNVNYGGDGNYLASSTSDTLTVTAAPQTITFNPLASPLTFSTSTISLTATASSGLAVSFSVLSGPATISGTTLTLTGAGIVQIAANQAGNTNYLAATQVTQSLQATQATPTIAWSAPTAINYGTLLSATQLNATATGVNGATLPGTFTYSPALGSLLGPGTQTLTVTFVPNDAIDYVTTSKTITITVNLATPSIVLAATPNPILLLNSVTAQATVTGVSGGTTPTGTVSFYDGGTLLGTSGLNAGVALLNFTPSVAGTHSLTAIYNGNTGYLTVTSTAVSELVQDFNLTISASAGSVTTATVLPGKTATYNLVISPLNAATFPANITLTVSGLPAGATYTLTPSSIAAGAGSTNLTLTVTAANAVSGVDQHQSPLGRYAPFSLALLFLPGLFLSRKMRSKLGSAARLAILLVAGFAAVAGMSGCGISGAGYFGQPATNYTITVTGAAGSLTHSTSVTLTVQ